MEIKQFDKESFHIIAVTGRIDANTAAEFEQKMMQTIESGNSNLLLDCAELEFISSAGLRALLILGKKLKFYNRYLIIAALSTPIKEAFDVSGFSTLFNLYLTVEDAFANVSHSQST